MITSLDSHQNSPQRTGMFIRGFESLSLIKKYLVETDIIWIDNTIETKEKIPNGIVKHIPEECEIILNTSLNVFGKQNKGAGVIECIKHLGEKILDYDFYIHHEPRTVILDTDRFCRFFLNEKSLFARPTIRSQFWTGTFRSKPKDIFSYANEVNLKNMCSSSISLEDDLPSFYNSKKIEYETMDLAGVLWHDCVTGTYRDV